MPGEQNQGALFAEPIAVPLVGIAVDRLLEEKRFLEPSLVFLDLRQTTIKLDNLLASVCLPRPEASSTTALNRDIAKPRWIRDRRHSA